MCKHEIIQIIETQLDHNRKLCLFDNAQYCTTLGSNGGSGFLRGSCSGSTLMIRLHNTREIRDLTLLQYAASTAGAYSAHHGMRNCDPTHCKLLEGGKLLEITVPNASGKFCLFVIGFNVSLTLVQSYCDGTHMRQVIVLPHRSAPVAGT